MMPPSPISRAHSLAAMADDKKQKTLFLDDAGGIAPPAPSAPLSSQSTVMMEATPHPGQAAGAGPAQRQMVVPTMMKLGPQGDLPPMHRRKKPSTAGRWIAGPLLSAAVAAGTFYAAKVLLPAHAKNGGGATGGPTKPMGKMRVNTEPPSASILVDGKRFPHYTPTTIEGEIGSTMKLTFKLDGYKDAEREVYVIEGEHPFNVKLESLTPQVPAPNPTPVPTATPAPKKEHHHSTAAKEPEGEGTITVTVRPWAIVYIDGQKLRQTPIHDYSIKSGHHTIELVNENKSKREKVELNLKPSGSEKIERDWD
jgi:hypothetical protein